MWNRKQSYFDTSNNYFKFHQEDGNVVNFLSFFPENEIATEFYCEQMFKAGLSEPLQRFTTTRLSGEVLKKSTINQQNS